MAPDFVSGTGGLHREQVVRGMNRVLDALDRTSNDPEEQVKVLMNVLGYVVATTPVLNHNIIVQQVKDGIPRYVMAYQNRESGYVKT